MIKTIVKRDGITVPFNEEKITNAIYKANKAVAEEKMENFDLAYLTKKVVQQIEGDSCTVEQVQDIVEKTLMKFGWEETAKAYIIYRQKHAEVRRITDEVKSFSAALVAGGLGPVKADATEFHDPQAELDVIKNQNASVGSGTVGAAILQESEAITKLFWESKYDPEIRSMSQIDGGSGEIYIHDMGFAGGYCAGWSLKDLIMRGISGVPGKIASAPARHLTTLSNQMVNFLGILQNEWAGAQAFSSFDTYLAPFVKIDNLTYKQTKQCIQSFVFGVNTPSRWGCQAPFSNITLDWTVPADMKDLPAIVGGEEMDFTYGDCQPEMDMVNKAFIEVMIEGDSDGRGFAYPIPTYSITRDFDWSDTENNRLLFEMAAKYGTPYFSNYINSDMDPSDVRSMCCRLRLDLRELRKQNGGNFGAGENTGSIGVVTINLPQIAYTSETEDDFFTELTHAMDVAARSLDIKRKVVTPYLERENSAYPYTKAYLTAGFYNHFSTIGLVGMNEACLNAGWLGKDLTDPECLAWAEKVLDFMREKLADYQEKYGCLFNLEATPAESTCYTLARKDKKAFPDIITAGGDGAPYYTNSSHLPVGKIDDVFEALEMEDNLQTKYTSGTVFHAFLGQRMPDWESAANLVRKIAENFELPYFTLSPTYSICEDHGYLEGEQAVCPHCGKKTEVYSRITGYYRAVSNWNNGKASEFKERKTYNVVQPSGGECDACNLTTDIPEEKTAAIEPEQKASGTKITILTTSVCPKCKMVKAAMDGKGIKYDALLADEDETGRALAVKHDVMSVPVLIVNEGDKETVIKDFSEILKYVNQQ